MVSRRERRQIAKAATHPKTLLRKKQISKDAKVFSTIFFIFFTFLFCITTYAIWYQNGIRTTVVKSEGQTKAKVLDINFPTRVGGKEANYFFNLNGRSYSGSTFQQYNGKVGDSIYVKYYTANPNINIYYKDIETAPCLNNTKIIFGGLALASLVIRIFSGIKSN